MKTLTYLFLARFPLLLALTLVVSGFIADWLFPQFFESTLIVNLPGMGQVAFLMTLASLTVMLTLHVVLGYGGTRFDVPSPVAPKTLTVRDTLLYLRARAAAALFRRYQFAASRCAAGVVGRVGRCGHLRGAPHVLGPHSAATTPFIAGTPGPRPTAADCLASNDAAARLHTCGRARTVEWLVGLHSVTPRAGVCRNRRQTPPVSRVGACPAWLIRHVVRGPVLARDAGHRSGRVNTRPHVSFGTGHGFGVAVQRARFPFG